jgi:hypothetical protein
MLLRRAGGAAVAIAILGHLAGFADDEAFAAPWCGTTTTANRPPSLGGESIRVVYAIPSDGVDRSAERAATISADVDEVTAWWRTQDSAREPRFDRVGFMCGLQADILVVRLAQGMAALRSDAARFDGISGGVLEAAGRSPYEKELIYYDGPVDDADICGQGGTTAGELGVAVVYLAACTDIPSAAVAAHELLHGLGALPDRAPHACPDSSGHPCDSSGDILYLYASSAPLSALVLDVGHDDYYGHSGDWLDVQDSAWLRLVNQHVPFTVAISGKGSVESDVPGVDCDASCTTDWDAGSVVSLEALAAEGQRFVRWSGPCTGSGTCEVTLAAAQSVGALFAPERYGLALSLTAKGAVSGAGSPCRVSRCQRSATSFAPLRLRATATAGWRFVGWTGGCAGPAATCTLPMTKATSVRARFVRR